MSQFIGIKFGNQIFLSMKIIAEFMDEMQKLWTKKKKKK